MAQMIGARRNSVSLVANTLQQANFIHYSRGHIEITNLDGLQQDRLRMLRDGQGPVRTTASAAFFELTALVARSRRGAGSRLANVRGAL